MRIKLAHDFNCPWCWIALFQTQRLTEELGVTFDWVGYELMPENLPWPETAPTPNPEARTNRPPTPSRMDLAYAASQVPKPPGTHVRRMRTHNALQAAEHAKHLGVGDQLITRLYQAYWLESEDINDPKTILRLAKNIVTDLDDLAHSITTQRYADLIVPFDDEAYAAGVFNVPTFFIGDTRYAEQPTSVLRAAIRAELAKRKS